MRYPWIAVATLIAAWGSSSEASAATLPEHDPLTILIVSDEVNPHGLSDGDLTQPGDLEAAIGSPSSGINVAAVSAVASSCVDGALDALESNTADVLVYFAHRAATDCAGSDAQPRFDDAVQSFLAGGGGVVVFHHGIYTAPGKEGILQIVGGTASQIAWDTNSGQDLINVAPEHFVTTNEIEYSGTRAFGDPGFGIEMGDYPVFNNTPDERYPGLQFISAGGEDRTVLFASDYSGSQVLGYDLHRPEWAARVVFYQPGEYQPNALDDLDGNNFQIFANAIYYVATTAEDPIDPTGGDETTSGGDETSGGDDSTSGSDPSTTGVSASGGGPTSTPPDDDTDTEAAPMSDAAQGCSCRTATGGFGRLLLLLALGLRRRRAASGA